MSSQPDQLNDALRDLSHRVMRAGPRGYLGDVKTLNEPDVIETALYQFGRAMDTLHDEEVAGGHHQCPPIVRSLFETLPLTDIKCWDHQLLPEVMFAGGIRKASEQVELLRMSIRAWRGMPHTPAAMECVRLGLRYFRYYWYLAGFNWRARQLWDHRVVPADHDAVAFVTHQLDAMHADILSNTSTEKGHTTVLGMYIPMGAVETFQMRKPKVRSRPAMDQMLPNDGDKDGTLFDQSTLKPEIHWDTMREETREAWRAIFFATLMERNSKDPNLHILGRYIVSWHQWTDPIVHAMLMERQRKGQPLFLPRIMSFGTGWGVGGTSYQGLEREATTWFAWCRTFAHAVTVWLQVVKTCHFHRYETSEEIPLRKWLERLPPLEE